MSKEVGENEPIETRGRARKASRSRDMLSSLENQVVNLEEYVGDMKETLEVVLIRMEELREDSKEFVLDSLISTLDKLTVRDKALEALVTTMKKEIAELKGSSLYLRLPWKVMLASGPKQCHVDVLKPEKFKGARSVREVDNFLWELEQYFKAMGIEDNATKHAKKEAHAKLRRLTQQCTIRDYVREFSELILQISDLNKKEAFYWFEDGLKMWAKQELRRLGITELTIAMAEEEIFYNVGGRKFDNSESSKPKSRPKGNGGGKKDPVEKND
ncbi:hypothetical protein CXB51_033770 [Gossypium anomalum]|uniref:Retrotransposon gag domain-containing protein n=1 Tax=Gossypium anomalum TaxID=47600 RepID=A0A8J5Y6Q1_9ROSI|nr:hypothetical protein CXB51_033770 [Gossypium anomalum]